MNNRLINVTTAHTTRLLATAIVGIIFTTAACSHASVDPLKVPAPTDDLKAAEGETSATAVFAGGCFWCTEAVFERVPGVTAVESGYAGGTKEDAVYGKVGAGKTGHAESIKVTYDPKKVTYGRLLQVFFAAAHDPTELNRQGPDSGTQYRSTIFVANDDQKRVAENYIKQLNESKVYESKIATTIETGKEFYPAEGYHQDYAKNHPDDGYLQQNLPAKIAKIDKLLASWISGG